jgi:hypothetical protein
MLLSRARKNVLRGNIIIVGNEFMQPGEVVFIEDRGLLFYISSVTHNFTYGGNFTTSLELTYGHTPGEYIPTTLDVVGKMLFNNRDANNAIIQRQSNSLNESNIGIIQREYGSPTVVNTKDSYTNKFSNDNAATLNNILFTARKLLNDNNSSGKNTKASIELRIYYDNDNPVSSELLEFANSVKNVLTGISDAGISNTISSTFSTNSTFEKTNVKDIVQINMSDENDRRSPSQKALMAARNYVTELSSIYTNQYSNYASYTFYKDKLRYAIFNYVVDCFIKIDNVTTKK